MNLVLLENVLSHLHNWFVRDSATFTDVEISGGQLPEKVAEYVPSGVFYRIQGSYLNDGLHKLGDDEIEDILEDEKIERVKVSLLAIPKPLLLIVDEIEEWERKYGEVAKGPYFSEEFGGYKYQIRGFSSYGVSGSPLAGWRLAFANQLAPWRKMY